MSLLEPTPVPERPQTAARTYEDISSWLVSRIAQLMEVSPEKVDIHQPFAEFGLNSVEAVNLVGDLEQWLGRQLADTLAWDYPTIEALAKHLAQ